MPRFIVRPWSCVQAARNAAAFEPFDEFNDASYLVDTNTNTIVFSDANIEPEDATLGRRLSPLVDLLNSVAPTIVRGDEL